MPQKKVLEYAALAECASSHPISKSLQRAYGGEIDRHRVTDVQEISGNGITAKVDGTDVAVGNSKLMDRLGIAWHDCHSVGTIIHLGHRRSVAGPHRISTCEAQQGGHCLPYSRSHARVVNTYITGISAGWPYVAHSPPIIMRSCEEYNIF